jgi:hypothetical protein
MSFSFLVKTVSQLSMELVRLHFQNYELKKELKSARERIKFLQKKVGYK